MISVIHFLAVVELLALQRWMIRTLMNLLSTTFFNEGRRNEMLFSGLMKTHFPLLFLFHRIRSLMDKNSDAQVDSKFPLMAT